MVCGGGGCLYVLCVSCVFQCVCVFVCLWNVLSLCLTSVLTSPQDILLCNLRRGDADFRMSLIVREWRDFNPELEIRAFVFDNKLTAATQYYSIVPIPLLVERQKVWVCVCLCGQCVILFVCLCVWCVPSPSAGSARAHPLVLVSRARRSPLPHCDRHLYDRFCHFARSGECLCDRNQPSGTARVFSGVSMFECWCACFVCIACVCVLPF